jgi:glycosyltransferase involved in cell wall biosynthesis
LTGHGNGSYVRDTRRLKQKPNDAEFHRAGQVQVAEASSVGTLRVAMIAPPWFDVPAEGYGGVEAVVADIVDGLVQRGHHVTLIGAGRAGTRAQRFIPTWIQPPSERLGEELPDIIHTARVGALVDALDLDVIHDHTLSGPLLARNRSVPTLVTVHGPVDGELGEFYRALGDTVGLAAVSASQRSAAPDLPWLATVHNAVQARTFPFCADKQRYTVFLGRFHPDKAPHLAIDASREAGLPIVLAGKCSEPIEREYFVREIEPRLGDDVTFIGVANAVQKRELLQHAYALVFPICWEEPFGLVMIEAMACGTPVVALRRGSVPEIVTEQTGVVVDCPGQLGQALVRAASIDPAACRRHVEKAFSMHRMALHYERAYRLLLAQPSRPDRQTTVGDAA